MAVVTGTAAAAGASGAKTAATYAGLAISALGAIQQGRAAQSAAEFESAQLQQQAKRDREIASQEAEDFENQEARRRARFRALKGGSGSTLEGSSLAVLGDLASEAEFQRLRILAGGETRASAAENTASLRRFEGGQAKRAGFTRAGATLLTGAGRFGKTT